MRVVRVRFAILGEGAIAHEVLRLIEGLDQAEGKLEYVGAITRDPSSRTAALTQTDVVVEAASAAAVQEHGPSIVAAGADLIVASIGAFAESGALSRLRACGSGRVHLSSGAIGGLDLLSAAGRTGGLKRVSVQSRKLPVALAQDWMTDAERSDLLSTEAPVLLFSGTPADAVARFPASLNVAVAVAAAVGDSTIVRVELVADPAAKLTTHIITANGSAGDYSFTIKNAPLAASPASSGLTARALVAELLRLAEERDRFPK